MKRYLILVILIQGMTAQACDVCPCVPGGGMNGIFPQFRNHFTGMRYQYRHFGYSRQSADPTVPLSLNWHSADLMMRFTVKKNWQFLINVPYLYGVRTGQTDQIINHGLGDISVQMNRFLINSGEARVWKHFLAAGAGIKAPTGFSTISGIPASMQVSTGAFDLMMNSTYIIRHRNTGLMNELAFRRALADKNNYQMGGRFSATCKLFYWRTLGPDIHLVPHFLTSAEFAGRDISRDYYVRNTGGRTLFGGLGADYFSGNLSFSWSLSGAIASKMADQITRPGIRTQASIIRYF